MNISSIAQTVMPQKTTSQPVISASAGNEAHSTVTTRPSMTTQQSPVQEKPDANQVENEDLLKKSIESVKEYVNPYNSNLEFSIDKETNQLIVKVVDKNTKEVIRQMPSEEMINLAKSLDSLKGLLIRQTA